MLTDHLEFHSARNKVELNELWPNKKTKRKSPMNSQWTVKITCSQIALLLCLSTEKMQCNLKMVKQKEKKNSWQICTYLVDIHWADNQTGQKHRISTKPVQKWYKTGQNGCYSSAAEPALLKRQCWNQAEPELNHNWSATVLKNNKLHGLSPPGGLVPPPGGFASFFLDQGVP